VSTVTVALGLVRENVAAGIISGRPKDCVLEFDVWTR
jgi:hypothetical protein